MSHPYEVLFNLEYDSNGNLVGVPAATNNNQWWVSGEFVFNKEGKQHWRDPHLVRFTLVNDKTGKGFLFPPVPRDAMWVEKGQTCPTSTSKMDYSVIEPLLVLEGGRTLIALNKNEKKQKWGITLNFLPSGVTNPNPVPWDPPGDNQDNGYGFTSTYAAITIGTVAFAAFSAYAFGMFENPDLVPRIDYLLVAVATLCFAALAAYLSGLFDR